MNKLLAILLFWCSGLLALSTVTLLGWVAVALVEPTSRLIFFGAVLPIFVGVLQKWFWSK